MIGLPAGTRAWLMELLPRLSRKSVTADAIRYALNQWQALTSYLDNGEVEIDNNAAERSLRDIHQFEGRLCTVGSALLQQMPAGHILHGDKGYGSNAMLSVRRKGEAPSRCHDGVTAWL